MEENSSTVRRRIAKTNNGARNGHSNGAQLPHKQQRGAGEDEEEEEEQVEEREVNVQVQYVVPLSGVIWIVIGIVIGVSAGTEWLDTALNYFRGYNWDSKGKCIVETDETNGNVREDCRPAIDCKFCKDITKIDDIHLDNMTIQMFEQRYAYTSQPLVVRNATLHWPAMSVLDYEWLKTEYASVPHDQIEECWFNKYGTKGLRNFASLFRLPPARVNMEPGQVPWYCGWEECRGEMARKVKKLCRRPSFVSVDSTPPQFPWIFIGTPGVGAHFHLDSVERSSWQAQIKGTKIWYLKPPPECKWTCGDSIIQITLYPGDIFVINTNVWLHATKILPGDLSLTLTFEYD